MKRINKILGLGIGIVAAFGLASCSNDINEPTDVVTPEEGTVENVTLNLVKTPDVVAWSGSQVIGDTRGTRTTHVDENGTKYYVHDEEVEVNLSLLDKKTWGTIGEEDAIMDLVTKLSIHVRCVTDVEVVLPVPTKYIIESDDLLIFMEHFDVNDENATLGVYGGSVKDILGENAEQEITYSIGDNNVTLKVSFEDNGIHVTTNGINEAVINACMEYNNDGINFEIYNYYQTAQVEWENGVKDNIVTGVLSEEDYTIIKKALNISTISFTGTPKYYINAFAWEMDLDYYGEDGKPGSGSSSSWHKNNVNPADCVVTPEVGSVYTKVTVTTEDEDEGEVANDKFYHLNGSPFNVIYIKEDETPDHAHGGTYDPNEDETPSNTNPEEEEVVE